LKERPDNLSSFLDEARKYAQTDYADALMKGSKLGEAEKATVAKRISHFTGLSEDYLIKANLRVNLPQFMKELQRSRGLTTGRLDARFLLRMELRLARRICGVRSARHLDHRAIHRGI